MKTVHSISEMQNISKALKSKGKKIGFVPTMGYLHQGHLSLINKSVKECDITVLSIYVNPSQFGPKEDFKKYPRDLKKDKSLAKKFGVDYLFAPEDRDMYPKGYQSWVQVNKIADVLCGASRPGHFKGVATVVLKLFNIILPDIAYFGQKDAQQAVVIKRMVQDLNIRVDVKVLPTVREPDGLALSSRNAYLKAQQRNAALALHQSLKKAELLILKGERNSEKIIKEMKRLIRAHKFVTIDYIAIVDAEDLSEKKTIKGRTLITLAVFIGKVRLIDNMLITIQK